MRQRSEISRFFALSFGVFLALAGCKPRADQTSSDVLGSVPLKKDAPPAVSYHFGQYRYLRDYGDRNGPLADQQWLSIPSNKKYSGFRRGFYLSQHPAYNERYALEYLTETRDLAPWVAEIHLKSDCITVSSGKRRFMMDLRKIYADQDFTEWVNRLGQGWSLDVFRQSCPIEAFLNQDTETTCHKVLNAFYREREVGVIYDHFWQGSGFWLVRDNQCIERVLASPKSVLDMFARERDLWREKPYDTDLPRDTQGKGAPTHALFHVLVRAIHETQPDEHILAEIERKAQESDYPVTTDAVRQLARVARHCAKQGQYEGLRAQTEFFLGKAEAHGYLNNDPKKANSESISYDTHMKRFVSFGLTRACDGAKDVVTGKSVLETPAAAGPAKAPELPTPDAPTPEAAPAVAAAPDAADVVQIVCNLPDQYCAPGKKTFLAGLKATGFTLDQLNLVRVYVDARSDTGEDGFSQNLKIRYDADAGEIRTLLKRRKQVVDITREFQKEHADLTISCALSGEYCLQPANAIRKILNENDRFNASTLRVKTIDVDARTGFFAGNYVDVRYDSTAGEIVKLLDQRLAFLKASDQVAASMTDAKVDCTLSGEYCPPAMWILGDALGKHAEHTSKALRIDRLTIGARSNFLNPKSMDIRYDMTAGEITQIFNQRLAFLKAWDTHLALFPNTRLDCELSGEYCQSSSHELYKGSAAAKIYDEKNLKIDRLVIAARDAYRDETKLSIRYDMTPSEVKQHYARRAKYVDQRDAFRARFPSAAISCEISQEYCQNTVEALFTAAASEKVKALQLELSSIRIAARGDDGKGSTLVIRYDSTASEIAAQLRARAK